MPGNFHSTLRRAIELRSEMSRAVNTKPADAWFYPHAHDLLADAQQPGRPRDDLLIVMQRVRLDVEQRALQHGVPAEVIAETAEKHNTPRLGHFEHDLVHAYLPSYLEGVDAQKIGVSFRLHARSAYRDTLRQRGRREDHRAALGHLVPEDPHTQQELSAPTADDPNAVTTGATHFAQWVPTPDQVHESLGFRQELSSLLDPLDYRIAELIMEHGIVQGDRIEIARLLSASEGRHISPGRITRALKNIRAAMEEIRRRRGVRRW
jgi:DNA-directed RNA polymerase specialized sigma24 family protein